MPTITVSSHGQYTQLSPQVIPTSLTDVIASDIRVNCITLTNTTGSPITVTIQDKQSPTPQPFCSGTSIDANATYVIEIANLRYFPGGLSWVASAAGLVGYISWTT